VAKCSCHGEAPRCNEAAWRFSAKAARVVATRWDFVGDSDAPADAGRRQDAMGQQGIDFRRKRILSLQQ